MASAIMVSPFQEESAEPSAEDVEMKEEKVEPVAEETCNSQPEPVALEKADVDADAEPEKIKPDLQWTHEELHRLLTLRDLVANWHFIARKMGMEFGSTRSPDFFDVEICQRKYDRITGASEGKERDKDMLLFVKTFLRKTSSERHAEGNAAKLSRVRRYFELAQYAMQGRLTEVQIVELLGIDEYDAFVNQSILEREGEKESWMLADLFCSKLTEEDWDKARKPEDLINKLNTLPINRGRLRFKHPTPSTDDEEEENASISSDMDYEIPNFNQSFTSTTASTERPARIRKLRPQSPDPFTTPTTQPTKRRRSSPKSIHTPATPITPRTRPKSVKWEVDDPAAVLIDGTSENITIPVSSATTGQMDTPTVKRGRGRPRKIKSEPAPGVIKVEDLLNPSTSQAPSSTPSSQSHETPEIEIISDSQERVKCMDNSSQTTVSFRCVKKKPSDGNRSISNNNNRPNASRSYVVHINRPVSNPTAIRNVRLQTQRVDARKIRDDEVICLDSDSEMDVAETPHAEVDSPKMSRRRGRSSITEQTANTEKAAQQQRIKIMASNEAILQRFPAIAKAAAQNETAVGDNGAAGEAGQNKATPKKTLYRSRRRSTNVEQPPLNIPLSPTSAKSTLLSVHAMIIQHPKSPSFRDEVTKELAPGYSNVIKRQMNLTLIKRLIEEEKITSLTELSEHYVLMCMNAIMFNEEIHPVYAEAQELMQFCIRTVQSMANGIKHTGGVRVNTRRSNKFIAPPSMGTAQRIKEPLPKKEEPKEEILEETTNRRSRNNPNSTPKTQRRMFTHEPTEKRIRRAK